MLRDNWKFEYTASKLAAAAAIKKDFHQERLEWWKAKRDEVMNTIRAEGLEIDEKIVMAYSNPKARDWDRGAEVMIRNDLQKDLQECLKKLQYHSERADDYDGWQQVLAANPETRQQLDQADWIFFFGRHTG